MKNILVVGGSYFAGKVFVEELKKQDDCAIYVMNRGNRPLNLTGVEELVCDRHTAANIGRLVPTLEWHAVVDFCAYAPEDVEILLQNLTGKVQQYIYFSTCTVYQNSFSLPMNEDSPPITGPLPGPQGDYAYKKWLTEMKLRELCQQRKIACTILRPAFIYGKYNYAPRESYFFDLIKKQEPIVIPSMPQALFTVISVWDVAAITISCLGNKQAFGKAFNLSSTELISYGRLIEVLKKLASGDIKVQKMGIAEIYAKNLPLPFPLTEHLVYSGALAEKTLGCHYLPYEEGMRLTYEHYMEA